MVIIGKDLSDFFNLFHKLPQKAFVHESDFFEATSKDKVIESVLCLHFFVTLCYVTLSYIELTSLHLNCCIQILTQGSGKVVLFCYCSR